MKATLFCCVPLLVLSAFTFGQSSTPTVSLKPVQLPSPVTAKTSDTSHPDYSDEPLVIRKMDRVYQVEADGTGWRLLTTSVKVQTEAAVKQFGVLTIGYAANSESVEIVYARVRRPELAG